MWLVTKHSIESKSKGSSQAARSNTSSAVLALPARITAPPESHPREAAEAASSRLLSRRQVAEILGVCTHSVQRLTRRGLLPAKVFNRRLIRYDSAVVQAFIEAANVG